MDLPYNPFDFANPVVNGGVFAGRKAQREDVQYYLNHALHARPIHLALTGDRAAGKTSMLNMIGQQAAILGFLLVRIDLNIGDAEPVPFFQRLYDSVLMGVVRDDKFGGLTGRTWRGYRNLVDAGVAADDLPLHFPAHISAVMGGTRRLSVAVLRQDLIEIQAESSKRIVVVIDECDVLSTSPETLQILRNLFSDLDKFMFVIAGTPRLFPVIDEVFSPIVRQFKKITIAPFQEEAETQECIVQPLKQVGLDPSELIMNLTSLVGEIHQLTGGRPYEIQLLCHAMFRRIQDGSEDALLVNLEALDAVRKDLENSQADNVGRRSHLYSALSPAGLTAIRMIRRVENATAERAYLTSLLVPYTRESEEIPSMESFTHELTKLVNDGILNLEGDRYSLAGDQFDEVYLRYLAASRDIYIASYSAPLVWLLERFLRDSLNLVDYQHPTNPWSGLGAEDLTKRISGVLSGTAAEGARFRANEWTALYRAVDEAQREGNESFTIAAFSMDIGGTSGAAYLPLLGDGLAEQMREPAFLEFRSTFENLDGHLAVEFIEIPLEGVRPIKELAPSIDRVQVAVASQYDSDAYRLYEQQEISQAETFFSLAFDIRPTVGRAVALCFLALNGANWSGALDWAGVSATIPVEDGENYFRALADFDSALAWLMLGDSDEAKTHLEQASLRVTTPPAGVKLYLLTAEKNANGWALLSASSDLKHEISEMQKRLLEA
jgi:hypothetical protein